MKITRDKIYFHAPYRMLLKNLHTLAENRINCEIYIDGDGLDKYNQVEIDEINATFEKYGLSKIAHGPFLDLNPGSRDSKIREFTSQRFIAALEFCKKIKTDHIVLHSGFQPIYYKNSHELFLDLSMKVWKEISEFAIKNSIVISIENSIDPTPEIILKLLERIKSPNINACFDIGHYNTFGQKPVLECLKEYPPDSIGEIHLSDNNGDFDSHLALGEGQIDFVRFFKEMDKMGIEPILTSEPHSMEDIEKNIEYLLSIGK